MKLRFLLLLLALLAGAVLSGCASGVRMLAAPQGSFEPTADQAAVVFLRPSALGNAIAATVYEVTDNRTEFLGVVNYKDRLARMIPPGRHLFMVVGENADFMLADVEAGKTYYALVAPRMGVWKARFSLKPIKNEAGAKYSIQSDEFRQWMEGTAWVEMSPDARAWYAAHVNEIEDLRLEYMQKWEAMLPSDKDNLHLKTTDGVLARPGQPTSTAAAAPPASAQSAAHPTTSQPASPEQIRAAKELETRMQTAISKQDADMMMENYSRSYLHSGADIEAVKQDWRVYIGESNRRAGAFAAFPVAVTKVEQYQGKVLVTYTGPQGHQTEAVPAVMEMGRLRFVGDQVAAASAPVLTQEQASREARWIAARMAEAIEKQDVERVMEIYARAFRHSGTDYLKVKRDWVNYLTETNRRSGAFSAFPTGVDRVEVKDDMVLIWYSGPRGHDRRAVPAVMQQGHLRLIGNQK